MDDLSETAKETFYQVAKMRAEFELLKAVIMDNLELDYSGEKLTLKDDKLVIALMETIEPDDMAGILNVLRAEKEEKIRKAMKKQEACHG